MKKKKQKNLKLQNILNNLLLTNFGNLKIINVDKYKHYRMN